MEKDGEGGQLLEVQFITKHLQSLGAIEIPNARYLESLAKALQSPMKLKKEALPMG